MQVDAVQDLDGKWLSESVGHTINGNWYLEGQSGKWYLEPEGVCHSTEASIWRQRQRERFNDP